MMQAMLLGAVQAYVTLSPRLPAVHRLGLASRGDTRLDRRDVDNALERGVNYLNWCGHVGGMSRAIAALGAERRRVVIATQIEATTAEQVERSIAEMLAALNTDYLDVVTFYWMESREEWESIRRGGALQALRRLQESGVVRLVGVTSHQRKLAAAIATEGEVDLLMIRFNAAHLGAETDVFPITDARGIPVVAYTCLRWGALIRPLPSDEPGAWIPRAPDCYRFVMSYDSVSVALMAPDNRRELEEDLALLDDFRPMDAEERARLLERGRRVRAEAGAFP